MDRGIKHLRERLDFSLGFGPTQEELDRISHPLGEFVRSGEIHGPLTHDSIEKSFNKVGKVNDRKIAGDLPVLLTFSNDLTQQADRCGFRPSQFWRANWVHPAGQNYGLPKRSPHLGHISQSFVKSAQALSRRRLDGQFGLQAFGLAGKRTASHFAQYRVFAGKITAECRLADFQGMNNVVDACVFIAALTKKMQCRFDDLLTKARFLTFAKTGYWFLSRGWMLAPFFRTLAVGDAHRHC